MHGVLNCTAAQTATAWCCNFGPGGVSALAPLSRLQGNCFFCAEVIHICDWIIRPRARKATFVARLGCFSALPQSWLFQRDCVPASAESRWYCHILYSVYSTVKKTVHFIKTHFPSEPPFSQSIYCYLWSLLIFLPLTLLAFKNTAEASVSVLMGFSKWFIHLRFFSAQVLIGFPKKKRKKKARISHILSSWTMWHWDELITSVLLNFNEHAIF